MGCARYRSKSPKSVCPVALTMWHNLSSLILVNTTNQSKGEKMYPYNDYCLVGIASEMGQEYWRCSQSRACQPSRPQEMAARELCLLFLGCGGPLCVCQKLRHLKPLPLPWECDLLQVGVLGGGLFVRAADLCRESKWFLQTFAGCRMNVSGIGE